MAYAVKYLFKFQSSNGTVREIRVLKDGYSGDVIQRPLGRAPVIKKEKNGCVHGTSLTFYAECHIDREYIEFYTSDPKEYRVDVYAGSTLLWQGYITPELYSEPDIAPPYDVQVVATDGVGELKLYDFAPQGTVTLRALLSYLLGYTGLTTDVNLVSSLKPGSRGAGALLDMQICVDYLAGKTCYEALTYILTTLHATITRWGGAWVLVRETNVTFTSDKVRYFNTSGNSALLSGSVQTLGAMRAAPAWPVGQLSTVIDPAKNKVVVQAPWHPVTGLTNPDMTSDTGWSKSNGATYSSGGYLLPNVGSSAAAFISQTLSMAGLRTPTSFELRVTGVSAELGTRSGAVIGVLITYTVGSTVYLLRKGDEGTPVWQQGADPGPSIDGRVVDYQQPIASFDADRIQSETLSIEDIPAFVQGTSYPSGTLKIYIVGVCARVYSAHLDVVLPKGYQDILRIDNGARGEGDSVEIAIGRVTSEVAYYQSFLQGLLLDTGSIITSFSDANFTTAMDYLALISRDYALSAALPRALAKGTVYLENSIGMPPLVFAKGGLNYWLETWSWDLYEDELEIDARTLPSASLTVQSETILESDGSTVSSSSSGSSGGGSSISPGGGVTYFEPHNDGIILKADYDYVSVPDVLLGDDEESLTSLLAIIAGNAAQGAAAYGYFNNGVLPYNHGGTGFSTYTKGDLLYASANNTLAKLAANSTATKKFLTMTSSVPSWGSLAFGDLPALYLGTTQIQSSSAAQAVTGVTNLTMSGKLTIGSAEIEWVAPVGTTPGYLKINSALLTDGDQIVGGGTPGGGGGGGAQYLTDLLDVKYGLNPSADDLLIYSSSVPLNPDGTVTGPGWTTIAKSSVGRIYTGGAGITIGNDNTISVTANTYAPYNSAGYLPLSAGSSNPLTGALYVGGTFGNKVVLETASGGDNWCNILYWPSSGKNWSVGAGADTFYWYRYGSGETSGTIMSLDRSGYLTAAGFKVGTSTGFLKADGTVDATAYLPLTGGNMTGVVWRKMSADTSNYENAIGWKKKADDTVLATIGYYNTVQKVFINPIGSSEVYSDAVGKYSLVIGNNSLTYNTYSIYHSGNSNKSDVNWTAQNLTAYYAHLGNGNSVTNLELFGSGDGAAIGFYKSGTRVSLLYSSGDAPFMRYNSDWSVGYTIYDSGNANKSNVAWACSTLTASDSVQFPALASGDDPSIIRNNSNFGFQIMSGQSLPIFIGFRSNSTPAIYIKTDGNVGIGTTSPRSKVSIHKAYAEPGTSSIASTAALSVGNSDDRSMYFGMYSTYAWIQACYFGSGSTTSSGNTNNISLNPFGGNVGIGTTSPGYKLDVSGSIRATSQLVSTVATGTEPLSVSSTTKVTNLNADYLDGFDANNIQNQYGGGWCAGSGTYWGKIAEWSYNGTGTIDMSASFAVTNYSLGAAVGTNILTISCRANSKSSTPTMTVRWAVKNRDMNLVVTRIYENSTFYIRIYSYSNGWNETVSIKLLDSHGWAGSSFTSWQTYAAIYTGGAVSTYSSIPSGETQYTISSMDMYVAALYSTGDQVISSDINLKTHLEPVKYTIEDIAKTRAVTFDWKDGRGHSAGSIAQDWKPLIPELVHGEEGNMTLAYGQIALVNTILLAKHETEQDKEIKKLKARVKELEKQLKMRRI